MVGAWSSPYGRFAGYRSKRREPKRSHLRKDLGARRLALIHRPAVIRDHLEEQTLDVLELIAA